MLVLLFFPGCMLLQGLMLVLGFGRLPWMIEPYFTFLAPLLLLVAGIYLRAKENGFKKTVKDADYRICTTCGFSLEGHESIGICPECGEAFTFRRLTADWREFTDPKQSFWRFIGAR